MNSKQTGIQTQIQFYRFIKVLSYLLIAFFPALFLYFLARMDFRTSFAILASCFLVTMVGASLRYYLYLLATEAGAEMSAQHIRRQTKNMGWLSLAGILLASLCFFAGLLTYSAKENPGQYALIFFTAALLAAAIALNMLSRRTLLNQHFELYRQQQVIIDQLAGLRQKGKAPLSDSLLA